MNEKKKKQKLEKKHQIFRQFIKNKIKKTVSLDEKWEFQKQLQALPRNSAPTRLHRRCFLTGRPRANYRDFGLSRHVLREMAHECFLPGITKSSW